MSGSASSSWLTPTTRPDASNEGSNTVNGPKNLEGQAATWPTPNARDRKGKYPSHTRGGRDLAGDVAKWPTPTASDVSGGKEETIKARRARSGAGISNLRDSARWWPTPNAENTNDGEDPSTWLARAEKLKEKGYNANGAGMPLAIAAKLWPTPTRQDEASAGRHTTTTGVMHPGTTLTDAVRGWPTPGANDHKGSTKPGQRRYQLDEATENRWATPRAEDSESTGAHRGIPDTLTSQVRLFSSPPARTTPDGASSSRSGPSSRPRFLSLFFGDPS